MTCLLFPAGDSGHDPNDIAGGRAKSRRWPLRAAACTGFWMQPPSGKQARRRQNGSSAFANRGKKVPIIRTVSPAETSLLISSIIKSLESLQEQSRSLSEAEPPTPPTPATLIAATATATTHLLILIASRFARKPLGLQPALHEAPYIAVGHSIRLFCDGTPF